MSQPSILHHIMSVKYHIHLHFLLLVSLSDILQFPATIQIQLCSHLYLLCGYPYPWSRQYSNAVGNGILVTQRQRWQTSEHRLHDKIYRKH